MEYTAIFLAKALAGCLFGWIWFGLPGLLALRLTPLLAYCGPAGLLCAPLLGTAVFGVPSLCVFQIVPYAAVSLVALYLAFNLVLWRLGTRVQGREAAAPSYRLSPGVVGAILALCLAVAVLSTLEIVPRVHLGGLYVGDVISDHLRIAMIDGIHRQGLPPPAQDG